MAIRDEQTSSVELRRDSRYHRAALLADTAAAHLEPAIKEREASLKAHEDEREEREGERLESLARLEGVDLTLDDLLRLVELEVLGAVNKRREDARYRGVFPRGLTELVALRGEAEARAVGSVIQALKEHFPEIAARHAVRLAELAQASVVAEQAWKQAETVASQAVAREMVARSELVRQLQRNEGALQTLYPGDKRKVRSYFRQRRKRGAEEGEE